MNVAGFDTEGFIKTLVVFAISIACIAIGFIPFLKPEWLQENQRRWRGASIVTIGISALIFIGSGLCLASYIFVAILFGS